MPAEVCNVIVAGFGGQGVLTAADILVDAAFAAGHDVKKSELHGMSQRGGSVHSDVRFGARVLSPMIPDGEADWLVVLSADQAAVNRHRLRPGGRIIGPDDVAGVALPSPRALNVAVMGALSAALAIDAALWEAAVRGNVPARAVEANLEVFRAARAAARAAAGGTDHG